MTIFIFISYCFIILNFRLYVCIIYMYLLIFYTLSIFNLKITYNTSLIDIVTNAYINDFYFNNFYFIWTQFFILPTLFLYLYYLHNTFFLKNQNIYSLVTVVFVTITWWWVLSYYSTNTYSFLTKNNQYFFNNLLSNPLNKYHPILFFITFLYVFNLTPIINTIISNRSLTLNKQSILTNSSFLLIKSNFYIILITCSLYLGSWWALQEGSWGGWWNWDASEVFGLLILTLLLIIIHSSSKYSFIYITRWFICTAPLIIIFTYLLLQMSYTIVSHNFGLSLLGYGYVHTFFITFLFLVVVMQFCVTKSLFKIMHYWINFSKFVTHISNYMKYTINHILINNYTTILILTFFTFLIYINSFNPIINNILWISFNFDLSNKWTTTFNLKLIIIFLLYIYFYKFNSIVFLNIYVFVWGSLTYIQPILNYDVRNLTLNTYSHLIIWLLLFSSIYLSSSLYTQWFYINQSTTDWMLIYKRSQIYNNLFFENTYALSTYVSINHTYLSNANTFFWFHNNPDTQFFQLILNENLLNQIIHNHTFMYLFQVLIIDTSSLLTDNIFSPLVLLIFYMFFFKTKIIF